MGIRISKKMGFFMEEESIAQVFDKDKLDEILEEEKDYQLKDFSKYFNKPSSVLKLNLRQYKDNISIVDHIVKIYDYDTFKGLLFQPISVISHNRHNDDIDYYEHLDQHNSPIFINTPIFANINFSSDPYVYIGKDTEDLKHGQIIDNLQELYIDYSSYFREAAPVKKLMEDKIIHWNVDQECWAFAQITGAVKPEVTPLDFMSHLQTSIITTWG